MDDTFDTLDVSFDDADFSFDSEAAFGFLDGIEPFEFYIIEPYSPYRKQKTKEQILREEMEAMELYHRMLAQRHARL